jgi:hypothetical protein
MNMSAPPKLALYLLDRFGPRYHREALAGDLIEQFQRNGSAAWVWREVLWAVLVARLQVIQLSRSKAKTALRIINAIMLAAAIALGVGTLTRADSPNSSCAPKVRC